MKTAAVDLLQRTLNEEGETDKKLTALAETVINVDASEAEEDEKPKSKAKKIRPNAGKPSTKQLNVDRHHSPRDCGGDFVSS